MSKKFYVIVLMVLSIVAVCLYFVVAKIKAQPNPNEMPGFIFLDLENKAFDIQDLPESKNYLVLYFSPDCHYCTDEIEDIIKNKIFFKNTYIVFVSPASLQELNKYNECLSKTGLKKIILQDEKSVFSKYFGPSSIPTTIIYNSKKELIKKIDGGSSAKYIYKKF